MKPAESLGLAEQLVPALAFFASIRGGIILLLVLLPFGFLLCRRLLRGESTRP